MKQKLQKIRKQSELLRGLAAELISNIDDVAEEYASILNEVQKLRKYKHRIMKSLSISLKDDMGSEDTDHEEDPLLRVPANGAKRPASQSETPAHFPKRAATALSKVSPRRSPLTRKLNPDAASTEPGSLGSKLVNSLSRVKSFKKIASSSFHVLPTR